MKRSAISDYGLIGDMRSAALVSREGSVDWFCAPRFDSPAALASLLGDERNGSWVLAPHEPAVAERTYVADTLVLTTTWRCASGSVAVHDFMAPGSPTPGIFRVVEGLSGEVEMRSVLRVRYDYGRTVPWVHAVNGTATCLTAGPDSLWLSGPVRAQGVAKSSVTTFTVHPGEKLALSLLWQPSHRSVQPTLDVVALLEQTVRWWKSWVAYCTYSGPWREAVVRSLITLKALTYDETGGIVAAPTTSLPETFGGSRNWDYRFCWLRDASLALRSLMESGYGDEARRWREWLLRATAGRPSDLQTMYGVDGARRLPESIVSHLSGYGGARPVRVGNAAADQFQIDAIGEVIDTLCTARQMGIPDTRGSTDFQRMLLDHLKRVWHLPDEGIWEVRAERRHFTHSKVMAWLGFDASVRCAEAGLIRGPVQHWRATADQIHAEVCTRSYDSELGHFVSSYGSRDLDASLLLIGQSGFLAPDDERVARTVEAVRRHLSVDDLVLRYQPHPDYDGVDDGAEGAFLACSYWMVDALAGAKRTDEAVALFEKLLSLRNDLGLLAEEWDVASGQLAGNFPQAFSHLGLISSAANLAGAKASLILTRRANRRERLCHPSVAAVGGVTVAEQGERSAPVAKQLAFSTVDDCATSWEYRPSTRRSRTL